MMKSLFVFAALCTFSAARAGYIAAPYAYHFGIPLGYDGRVLDTPEVARAKAEHLATQAYEAARNTLGYPYVPAHIYAPAIALGAPFGAPLGADGRVIDTPEVAQAKAAHLTAHALEAARVGGRPYGALALASSPVYAYGYPYTAPIGLDGRVVDTPEVAAAKADHLAKHAAEAAKTSG